MKIQSSRTVRVPVGGAGASEGSDARGQICGEQVECDRSGEHGVGFGDEQLGRAEAAEFVGQLLMAVGAAELGGAEVAGGETEEGEAGDAGSGAGITCRNSREPVRLFGAEGGVGVGARGEDACDFASDEFFGELGIFDLLTESDAVALAEETLDVLLGGVVGDAAHGLLSFAVARGEGELQLARGDDGVLVEELIEVADADEHQAVGVGLLGGEVLAHGGRLRGEVVRRDGAVAWAVGCAVERFDLLLDLRCRLLCQGVRRKGQNIAVAQVGIWTRI